MLSDKEFRRIRMALDPYLKETSLLEAKVKCGWCEVEFVKLVGYGDFLHHAKVKFLSDSDYIKEEKDVVSLDLIRPKQPKFAVGDIVECMMDRDRDRKKPRSSSSSSRLSVVSSSFCIEKTQKKNSSSWDRFDSHRWVKGSIVLPKQQGEGFFSLYTHRFKTTDTYHISKIRPSFFSIPNQKFEYLDRSVWLEVISIETLDETTISLEIQGSDQGYKRVIRIPMNSNNIRLKKSWQWDTNQKEEEEEWVLV